LIVGFVLALFGGLSYWISAFVLFVAAGASPERTVRVTRIMRVVKIVLAGIVLLVSAVLIYDRVRPYNAYIDHLVPSLSFRQHERVVDIVLDFPGVSSVSDQFPYTDKITVWLRGGLSGEQRDLLRARIRLLPGVSNAELCRC
jgi:hypothetical protein